MAKFCLAVGAILGAKTRNGYSSKVPFRKGPSRTGFQILLEVASLDEIGEPMERDHFGVKWRSLGRKRVQVSRCAHFRLRPRECNASLSPSIKASFFTLLHFLIWRSRRTAMISLPQGSKYAKVTGRRNLVKLAAFPSLCAFTRCSTFVVDPT